MITPLRAAYFAIIYGALLTVAARAGEDLSSSPYLQVIGKGDDKAGEMLPLKSSEARISIDGTIARVHLTQSYSNVGSEPIEAIYVFPASTRAAVHGMTLSSGGRVVAARIRESVTAKAEYETAKKEKKTAALLEEQRPNVFQMSVANLLPGDDIDVEIQWTETVPFKDTGYEFVFPTVVGPRFTRGAPGAQKETWTANPYLHEGEVSPAGFQLTAEINTTLPLAEVTCPSHPIVVDFKAKDKAALKLNAKAGEESANRDFILRWKLGNEGVDAGLLLNKGASENHFLLQVAPPMQVKPEHITPRDYVMVVDVSGSMEGFPLNVAKQLLANLVGGLKEQDTFNVISFASGSDVLSEEPLAANAGNVKLARAFIDERQSGGGTELQTALKRALDLPGGENRSRSILVVTDGFIVADRECRDFIRENIGQANVFTFGIGSSVNRELLESVARAGGGEPVVVTSVKEAALSAERFREMISSPVLAKIRIEGEGVELSGVEPNPHGDVFARRTMIVTGKWRGEPKGKIVVRGIAANGQPFEKAVDLAEAAASGGTDHPALPVLWARERVRHLVDQGTADKRTVKEITELGLGYSLLTPYTSFLAVDETPREITSVAKRVTQPVPLPQGVGESAVAGVTQPSIVKNGSVPEPGSIGLIAFLVVLLGLQRQRDN